MAQWIARTAKNACPIAAVTQDGFDAWLKTQPPRINQWLAAHKFTAAPGSFCAVTDENGKPEQIVAGLGNPVSMWDFGDFAHRLPQGAYRIDTALSVPQYEALALGWELGAHRFTRYKKSPPAVATLALPAGADLAKIARCADAINAARDLVTTPAEDMGPPDLAAAIAATGKTYGAKVVQIVGDDLLRKNYPAIHRVGRAASRPPRLVDLTWGDATHPRLTLVGKGVCFDTGGLDLKPSSSMYLMKKDMGGSAAALAIARMVMDAKLPVRLRLLVPAVENSVSANAFRPTDVITMRNGTTVEVGNTDAEGRLVLADALVEAASEKPRWLLDFSTLTGAARTALGTDISALFCNNDEFAGQLAAAGLATEDPVWRLPLHAGYRKMLDSPVADLNSAPGSPYAGAITAALFLQHFVPQDQVWAHFDFMSYNLSSKPGRPEGGEAMAVRAVFHVIAQSVQAQTHSKKSSSKKR